MFISFFLKLRQQGLPVSIKEYLHLLEALDRDVTGPSLEDFYYLARATLIKHEGHWDAFDVLFGEYFRNQLPPADDFWAQVPEEWLRQELAQHLSPEDIAAIEAMGGLDALMARFRELLAEQDEAHAGGNQFIGTGGTSPFGNGGYNPEGFRQGGESRHGQAIKVWDRRQYANLNDKLDLNTRNLKVVLKGLRAFTREGRAEELDLDGTIRRTSENAGLLDLRLRPSRRNNVKVLLLLDAGGSMDDYVTLCSELFSAARYEFKHLEAYYFHNCLYEYVWRDNSRRFTDRIPTWDLLHTYNRDYQVIFAGDAAMSPLELTEPGGSVEFWNAEPGLHWLLRMRDQFPRLVWLNPTPRYAWNYYPSTEMIRHLLGFRMFPMTLEGIGQAIQCLRDPKRTYGDASDAESFR